MYYQNYEDYMRQVLGYPINDPNIYESYDYRNNQIYEDTYSSRNQPMSNLSEDEIRSCYPEIYHLVYPMICKVCDTNTQPITRELIEKMTDEVYLTIEDSATVVNVRVDTPKPEENRSSSNSSSSSSNTSSSITPSHSSIIQSSEMKSERVASREDRRSSRRDSSRNIELEDKRTPKSREGNTIKSVSDSAETNKSSVQENRKVIERPTEKRQFNTNLRDLIKILILFRLFGNRPIRPRPPRPPFPGETGRPPFPGGRPPIQPREYPNYLEF